MIDLRQVAGALGFSASIDDLRSLDVENNRPIVVLGEVSANDRRGSLWIGVTGQSAGTFTNSYNVVVPAGGNGSSAWIAVLLDRAIAAIDASYNSNLCGYTHIWSAGGRQIMSLDLDGLLEAPGTPALQVIRDRATALSEVTHFFSPDGLRYVLAIMLNGNLLSKGVEVDVSRLPAIDAAVLPGKTIEVFGDSFVQGNTAGVTTSFPAALQALLPGVTVNNRGRSGRTSLQVATAFGAVPSILTIQNNTIPASGPVSVTLTENGNFSSKSNFGTINVQGTLDGIPGTLAVAFNAADPNLPGATTFTRTEAGTAKVIPKRTPFIPTTGGWENNGCIFWDGFNDIVSGFSNESILANDEARVAFLGTSRKRFLFISVCDQGAWPAGTPQHSQILALNYERSRRWPYNFIDARSALVNSYNSGSPSDVTAFNQDQVPPSRQSDGLHLNDSGYAISAQLSADRVNTQGWLL